MYMRTQFNFAMKKDYRDYIDISKYTEMEIEHGLDTENMLDKNGSTIMGHFSPNEIASHSFPDFERTVNLRNKDLKSYAFDYSP